MRIAAKLFIVILLIFTSFLLIKSFKARAATLSWSQTNWAGGSGQTSWSDATKYSSGTSITTSTPNQVTVTPSTWYNGSWAYRRKITFDNSSQNENLTNFPVMVRLASSNFDFSKAQTSGQDIRFTDSDGTTLLNYEIEKWDNSGSVAFLWVKVPQIDASSTADSIYMYYGNGAASDAQAATSVWSNSYVGVYHLKETGNGTTGEYADSRGSNNGQGGGGTPANVPTVTTSGKIANAETFDGTNDYIDVANESSFDFTDSTFTISGWIKTNTSSSEFVAAKNDSATNKGWSINVNSTSSTKLTAIVKDTAGNSSAQRTSSAVVNNNAYHQFTAVITTNTSVAASNNIDLYIDGALSEGVLSQSGVVYGPNDTTFKIGKRDAGNPFSGTIDEMRVSSIGRTANWIAATYKSDVDTLNTYGSEELFTDQYTGTLVSSIFDTGVPSDFGNVTYSVTVPTGTSFALYLRTSNNPDMADATTLTSCTALTSGSAATNSSCVTNGQRYIQYEAVLTSVDHVSTPTFTSFSLSYSDTAPPSGSEFVQRLGNKLYLNGQRFKFAGANIYWLGLTDEPQTITAIATRSGSTQASNTVGHVDYPTKYEIDSALSVSSLMGHNVIRTFGAATVGCSKCIGTYINTFNDSAFDSLDYAIQQAGNYGIKFILPLSNHYWFAVPGGKHYFTDWENDSTENNFYTNTAVISDFKAFINHVLNHVNTYTGVAYKDDPTILAWETGNELLTATSSWTQNIAGYIKSIDSHHLVADGRSAEVGSHLFSNQLKNTAVDMYTGHFYPVTNSFLSADAALAEQYDKVYFLGEYDWTEANGGSSLSSILSTVEGDNNVSGDLFWNIWPQNDSYGYVTGDIYTFNYPGSDASNIARANSLRTHAYTMKGSSMPGFASTFAPYLYGITDASNGVNVWWRGSKNAFTYNIERSSDGGNTWVIVQSGVTDNSSPWNDTNIDPHTSYTYRIKAFNADSIGGDYSNTQTFPKNVIQNGSFENNSYNNSFAYWNYFLKNSSVATFTQDGSTSKDGSYSAKINVTNTGSPQHSFSVQLYANNLNVTSGQTYQLSFWAKADASRNIEAVLQQSVSPDTIYYDTGNVALTTDWQQFTYTFNASNTDSAANLYFNLSQTTGNIWIDNVSLTPQHLYFLTPTLGTNSLVFNWNTTIPSTTKVSYGATSSYGVDINNTSSVTAHLQEINSLNACTNYHYKVGSVDSTTFEIDGPDKQLQTLCNNTGPSCSDTTPEKTPTIYSLVTKDLHTLQLAFGDTSNNVTNYVLEYGTKSGNYPYGANNIGGKGTTNYTVGSLDPNQIYYFRVRAQNGCASGNWSNEISGRTTNLTSSNNLEITNTEIVPKASPIPTAAPINTGNVNSTLIPTFAPSLKTYDLQIKVVDTSNNPVDGASVTIHSTPQTTKTNVNGIARFSNVEEGNHQVLVAYDGFQGEQNVSLAGDVKEFNFNITVKPESSLFSKNAQILIMIIGGALIFVLIVVIILKTRKK